MTQENKHTLNGLYVDIEVLEGLTDNLMMFTYIKNTDGLIIADLTGYASDTVNDEDLIEANADYIVKCVNLHDEMLREMEKLAQALEDTGHEPDQSFYDVMKKARGM